MTKIAPFLTAICIAHQSGQAPLHALSPRSLSGMGGMGMGRPRRQKVRPRPRNPLGAKASLAPLTSAAESILQELHRSELDFRIAVIGKGATLETTSKVGPVSESSTSPGSEEKLLTFASEDRSFELRVKVKQVGKVAFINDERRVASFLDKEDVPIFSLTLMDKKRAAEKWFDHLVKKHGDEVVV